ncbi:DUF551 domain-containing protein [Klebsiella quasipneumoniae]
MTKSTITREQAQKIIVAADEVITALAGTNEDVHPDDGKKMCELWDDLNDRHAPPVVVRELARMALAAMDSEPVAWTDEEELRDVNVAGIGYLFGIDREANKFADPRRQIMLYRHAQPAPEYPEVLPCSVLLEPGLRFGKGIKTSSVLAALARRAVYESDMAALSQEERAEFQARIEDFKALIAHPVPVVPQDVLEALQKVARIRLDLNDFDGDRRGIADCLCDAEEALIEVVNRRADMLAAAPQPQNAPQNIPEIIPGWIPVSERMPEDEQEVLTINKMGHRFVSFFDKLSGLFFDKLDAPAACCIEHVLVTHWMPLPAAPQEAINALISVVSRNEPEVKGE